jgi:hypothetical protein
LHQVLARFAAVVVHELRPQDWDVRRVSNNAIEGEVLDRLVKIPLYACGV